MNRKNLLQIFPALIVGLAIGCETHHFNFIKANISSIEKAGDSTVLVKFEVYSPGNADDCHFWVVYDDQPGFSYSRALISRSYNGCHVMGLTEVSIPRIVPGKKYFYQLGEWGNWDVSGQTSSIVETIGDQWEYVLN